MKLAGISGSLRKGSYNTALLRNAQSMIPAGSTLEIVSIQAFPPFNEDLEKDGVPAPVAAAKEQVMAADGLVVCTPEYNGGMPGVLKNAIDWLSRPPPPNARVLRDKPVALMGATPGGLGTVFAQSGWLQVFRTLRMNLWVGGGPLTVSRVSSVIDAEGNIVDDDFAQRLAAYLQGFVESLSA